MKATSKLLIAAMCFIATASFTGCLGSSDDTGGIDDATYRLYLTNMSGLYYGDGSDWRFQNKIYFYNDTITSKDNTQKTDSVGGVTAQFYRDSVFVISGVPGRVLAKEIPDTHKELKEAIEAAPAQNIRGSFVIGYIQNSVAQFFMYPQSVTYSGLTYGGETHDVRIDFWSGWLSGLYGYVSSVEMIQMYLYTSRIYVDGSPLVNIYTSASDQAGQARAYMLVSVSR